MLGMEILATLLLLLFLVLWTIAIISGLWAWALYIGSKGDINYLAMRTPFNKRRRVAIIASLLAFCLGIILLMIEVGKLAIF